MSRLYYAKKLFGDGMARAVYSQSSGNVHNLGDSNQTVMRYGTVTKETWTDEATGQRYVEVVIDGSFDENGDPAPVTLPCDSMFYVGDRVKIIQTGTNVVVLPIPDTLVNISVTESVRQVGDKISEEVAAELKPLEDSFNQFKEEQQLTNETVSSQIADAVSTSESALESSTTAVQTVEGFKTEVNQKFEDYDLGVKEMNTKIEQNAQSISTEVSNREEAVSGALLEAKSYTDQQADVISQTVETNVTNSIGKTYATKSELTQTSQEITATFTGEVSDLDDKYETMIRLSGEGVEVGETSGTRTVMGSDYVSIGEGSLSAKLILLQNTYLVNYLVNGVMQRAELFCSKGVSLSTASPMQAGSSNIPRLTVNDYGVYVQQDGGSGYLAVGCEMLYNGSGSTSVSLSDSASSFKFVKVFVQSGGGNVTSVDIPNGKTGVATLYDNADTSWLAFVRVTVSGYSARIASELNLPVSAYSVGTGNGSVDAKIIKVIGFV